MANPLRRVMASSQISQWFGPSTIYIPSQSDLGFLAEFLIIGGGGGGGYSTSGGGGGGGFVAGYAYLPASFTLTVGAGGTAGTIAATGGKGANSVVADIIAIGGGGGATGAGNGQDGGSGGGPSWEIAYQPGKAQQTNLFPNATLLAGLGSGFPGGAATDQNYRGGGGGGAGAAGATGGASGNGGTGLASNITGSAVTYAGGGGAGDYPSSPGTGGAGGGGNGSAVTVGSPGTANRGGGAGGGANVANGGAGGSGFVALRFLSSLSLSVGGGLTSTNATSGGYKLFQFTAGTGTVTFS